MDRTTKVMLALIAAGLWANAVAATIRPVQAASEREVWLGRIAVEVQSLSHDFHDLIAGGFDCKNPKLCREP